MIRMPQIVPLIIGSIALLSVISSAPLFRQGSISIEQAWSLIYLGWGVGMLGVSAIVWAVSHERALLVKRPPILVLGTATSLGALVLATALIYPRHTTPSLSDVSTDVFDPPEFALLAQRRNAAGATLAFDLATGSLQREGLPDVIPMQFPSDRETLYLTSQRVVQRLGWQLVGASYQEGRVEAQATTRWFGLTSDIVIRIQADGRQTRVDVRSASRHDLHDAGANARFIRQYRNDINRQLGVTH